VGWYRTSARAGQPGNSVMSGHVDWGQNTAVFWGLRQLRTGDVLQVRGADGEVHAYAVEWNERFSARQAPVQRLVGGTEDAVLTLITCEGVYDRTIRDYTERRVVRARLIE
jgi:LPXTG-site transpeptidase (sortase) family protein